MSGNSGPVSTPFNDMANAAPGVWDWMKGAFNTVKNIADENPTATKWITFGLAAITALRWGGELSDWLLRAFPAFNNGFSRLLLQGLTIVGALVGANMLSQWITNRPGAVEHRQQVDDANRARVADLQAQIDQQQLSRGFNPQARQLDRSQSIDVVARRNPNHVPGQRYEVPDAALGPSGQPPARQPQTYGTPSPYAPATPAPAGTPGVNWNLIPRYPVPNQ